MRAWCVGARELAPVMGYVQWRNFQSIIEKAKASVANAGEKVPDHFACVSKMVRLGSGAERQIDDVMLTRYACYPKKKSNCRFCYSGRR